MKTQPKNILRIPSPTAFLKPWNQKFHWAWFDPTERNIILSNQRCLWTIDPVEVFPKYKPLLMCAEREPVSVGGIGEKEFDNVSTKTLKAFTTEGVRGFDFLELASYGQDWLEPYKQNLTRTGNALIFLFHCASWGLNNDIALRHRSSNTVFRFKDRSVSINGISKRFPDYTSIHCAHPTKDAFFTGNRRGEVHYHSFENGSFKRSKKIASLKGGIKDIVVSKEGYDLFIASLGNLSWFHFDGSKYNLQSEYACSPRHMIYNPSGGLLVNLGRNGISYLRKGAQLELEWHQILPIASHRLVTDDAFSFILSIPQGGGEDIIILRG